MAHPSRRVKQTPWFILLDAFKQALLADTITRTGGNNAQAARFLGLGREWVYKQRLGRF